VLGVFDPGASIPVSVLRNEPLPKIEHNAVGMVADGVNGNLETRRIGISQIAVHLLSRKQLIARKSDGLGCIGIRFEEPSRARAQRPVSEAFYRANLQLVRPKICHDPSIAQAMPLR
jgi:hypothetical protein